MNESGRVNKADGDIGEQISDSEQEVAQVAKHAISFGRFSRVIRVLGPGLPGVNDRLRPQPLRVKI